MEKLIGGESMTIKTQNEIKSIVKDYIDFSLEKKFMGDNHTIIWRPDYHFQVAGYAIAFEETYGEKVEKAFIARFSKGHGLLDKKNNKIQDMEIQEVNLELSKKGFLSLLKIKNVLKKVKKEKNYEKQKNNRRNIR